MKFAGIALIVLGVVGLVYGGIRYSTQDKIIDLGPIHAVAERSHTLPIAPLSGALLVAGGATLLILSRRRA